MLDFEVRIYHTLMLKMLIKNISPEKIAFLLTVELTITSITH